MVEIYGTLKKDISVGLDRPNIDGKLEWDGMEI